MRALLLLLAACSETIYFEPPDVSGMRSEIVAFHGADGLSLTAISRESPFAITFDADAPFLAESLLYRESLAELGLTDGPLSRAEGASRGLPEPAQIFRRTIDAELGAWEPAETASPEVGTFRIEGSCGLFEPVLQPFALRAQAVEGTVRDVELIDEQTVLALTDRHLSLIRRGEEHEATPATQFAPGHALGSFHYDRERGRIWVGGDDYLSELTLDASGLSLVQTSSGCAHEQDIIEAVDIDDLGRPIIATDRGAVCRWENGRYVGIPSVPVLFNAFVLSMVHTADPSYPLLAGSSARVDLFDAAIDQWTRGEGLTDLSPPFSPFALASRSSGETFENFAAGTGGRIFQQLAVRGWNAYSILFPPDYGPCAEGSYPELTDGDSIRALYLEDERILVAFEYCAAILELDRDDRCSQVLASELGTSEAFEAIDTFGSIVVAGGTNGLLYYARRR